jgi:hypothetical protein
VTSCDDPEFATIDDYIRKLLAEAAQTYASKVDLGAGLKEILEAEKADG